MWSEFYARSGLQNIQLIYTVRRRRLSMLGHVARMTYNVPAKAVLRVASDVRDGIPPFSSWRRLRGRPHITLLYQIRSDRGLSAGDDLSSAQDRAMWSGERTLRPLRRRIDDDDDDGYHLSDPVKWIYGSAVNFQ